MNSTSFSNPTNAPAPATTQIQGQLVTASVDEPRPHPSYDRHRLSVSASQLTALIARGDLAFREPIVITKDRKIIDGHARLELARRQGHATIRCIEYDLTPEQALEWFLHAHQPSPGLNDFIRIELALDLEPNFQAKARLNEQRGGREKGLSKLTNASGLAGDRFCVAYKLLTTPLTEGASYLSVSIRYREDWTVKLLAVVTGGSSGIGLALAKELAGRGYDLAICAEDERLIDASRNLESFGGKVTAIQADLATRAGVEQLWSAVQALGRPIDIVCINAGVGVGGLFAETDLDAELNMIALNCSGTIQLAKYVVRHMVERGEGRILITSSIAGEMVAPREAVYAATKSFDLTFAHSLRYELRDSGVTVTALQPGPTDTDFFRRAGMENTQVGSEGKSESQPEDVARQGIEALLAGKDHVYSASTKTKVEGMLANLTPGSVKGAMHEKMAKPKAS